MSRLLITGALCAAVAGCNREPYWRADENIQLFGVLTAKITDCKHFKWRSNADQGRTYQYSVRCTADGKAWTQYEVVPVSGSVTPSPLGTVDPHPEDTQTISLYDADTAYRVAQNQPKQSTAAPVNPDRAPTREDLKKAVALAANLNGLLCAEVKDVRPLQKQDVYEVTCVVYRGGSATKAYVLDTSGGRLVMWAI